MGTLTLEDHLRRATRNFTARLPEDQIFALGRDLLQELARAHGETPPRHPDLDTAAIPMAEGRPRLEGVPARAHGAGGDTGEDLFHVGALLVSLATGERPDVSWRLDGPPMPDVSTLARRDALATLAAARRVARFPSAQAAAAAFASAAAPPSDTPSPWPAFRGDGSRTGARPSPQRPVRLTRRWDAPVGAVVASPAIAAGFVVVPAADGRILFLEPTTGRVVHQMPLASAVESSPAVAGRLAWLGTDDGEVVAVDVVGGTEKLRVKVGQLVRSSPLATADRVFVGIVEPKGAGGLVALDPGRGKVLWRCSLGAVFSSPALAGGLALVGSDDGSLHAVDVEKGRVAWSCALGAKVRATPAVAGDIALVGDFSGRCVAVRVADGTTAWTAALGHPLYSSPCVSGDVVAVGCNEGHVHGLRASTGAPLFETPARGPVVASPTALGEAVVVGGTDGDLYLLDGAGTVVARETLSRGGIQSSAAVDRGVAYVGSASGVHAVEVSA